MSEQQSRGSAPEPAQSVAAGPPEPAGSSEAAGRFDLAAPLAPFDVAGLLARQWAEVDEPVELSAAEIAALPVACDELPDVEDVPWWLTDEFFGSDEAVALSTGVGPTVLL
jgi:hypothetical protein